ncbi:MAG TPA: TAXI family TRAP transporter solute-binding subunit [Rhodocyclaceae bacterium]|nr:TAXI family TRAP transporter solute-binding subunit [Rhodocyclaceae bacterium]
MPTPDKQKILTKLRLRQYSLRDIVTIIGPALIIIVLGFYVAAQFIKPAPPDHMTISGGAPGSTYDGFALRYKDRLARYGIDLVVQPSAGAIQNLERLRSGDADAAFIQSGSPVSGKDEGIVSLGSLYYEPLWVFYRAEKGHPLLTRLTDLRGKRIAIGPDGSGTRHVALELLHANGVNEANSRLLPQSGVELAARLRDGRLDAALIVGSPTSAAVWQLFYTDGVRLMDMSEAEAYTRHFPYLAHLVLPTGSVDMVKHYPDRDIDLVAVTATLAVREDLHPALMDLLLQAMSKAHADAGIFEKPKQFPNADPGDYPLADEAARYYKSGRPFLQRYLPFWLATLIDRTLVMLIPLIAVLLPVFKVVPAMYAWRIRSRIFKRYGELKFFEAEMERDPAAHTRLEWLERLDAIEVRINRLPTPLAFSDMLYTLRSHVMMVRQAVMSKTKE